MFSRICLLVDALKRLMKRKHLFSVVVYSIRWFIVAFVAEMYDVAVLLRFLAVARAVYVMSFERVPFVAEIA